MADQHKYFGEVAVVQIQRRYLYALMGYEIANMLNFLYMMDDRLMYVSCIDMMSMEY